MTTQTTYFDASDTVNNAGGSCHLTSDENYIRRIIVLGTEKSTYYATSQTLTQDACNFLLKQIEKGNGMLILNILKNVHSNGCAPKMTMTLAILGILTRCKDDIVRKEALNYTIYGLRTMSQVYTWLSFHVKSGKGKGFGRGPRTVLSKRFHNVDYHEPDYPYHMRDNPRIYWEGISALDMAYQFSKYDKRDGISVSDILSLIHIKPTSKKLHLSNGSNAISDYWPKDKQLVLSWAKTECLFTTLNKLTSCEMNSDLFDNYDNFVQWVNKSTLTENEKEVSLYLWACEYAKKTPKDDNSFVCLQYLIKQYKLPREVLNTEYLKNKKIWLYLLLKDPLDDKLQVSMPITALIRNLGVMSSKDMFNISSGTCDDIAFTQNLVKAVCDHLTNEKVILAGRVHPVALLSASNTYGSGHGMKGTLNWIVNPDIVNALNTAVDIAFKCVEPTGHDELHFVDVSLSMEWSSPINNVTCMEASTIQMLSFVKASLRNPNGGRQIVGVFDTISNIIYDSDSNMCDKTFNTNICPTENRNSCYTPVYVKKNMIDPLSMNYLDVQKVLRQFPMGGTDCSIPILKAQELAEKGIAFVNNIYVYTDNETWAHKIIPSEAMKQYRKLVPNAKLIVVAITPSPFTIADPDDAGMLDVVGFDTGAPSVIYDFGRKKL
jgi:60 kDa SS-A/Ro ribonucleoprotein